AWSSYERQQLRDVLLNWRRRVQHEVLKLDGREEPLVALRRRRVVEVAVARRDALAGEGVGGVHERPGRVGETFPKRVAQVVVHEGERDHAYCVFASGRGRHMIRRVRCKRPPLRERRVHTLGEVVAHPLRHADVQVDVVRAVGVGMGNQSLGDRALAGAGAAEDDERSECRCCCYIDEQSYGDFHCCTAALITAPLAGSRRLASSRADRSRRANILIYNSVLWRRAGLASKCCQNAPRRRARRC
ncbi:unnamed protein product, partial [Pelagomonas calceolata]